MLSSERIRLRILHTNDIHSRFEQMPKIATAIRRLRDEAGADRTVVLDIGDHLDRMFPETEGTDGEANMAVMNATGYDAATLGNNEGLTCTKQTLDHLYGNVADFPVVASNLPNDTLERERSWIRPYECLQKAGLRIALIGVTAYFHEFYRLLGWDIQEPVQTVRKLVEKLRPDADLVIVMSHLGLRSDERLAESIPGIDLILGGHTHHVLEQPLRIGEASICAAGKFGKYVGLVDIEFDPAARRLLAVSGKLLPADDWPPAADIAELIGHYSRKALSRLEQVAARLESGLELSWHKESPLGNLMASAVKRKTAADIALVNAGQLLEGLPPGPVTSGTLLKICPSPINACRMMLQGEQLLLALEQSLLPEFIGKPLYGFGFRGKELGTLCVDGITVEYDPAGAPMSKIRRVLLQDGVQLLPKQKYNVGTIDMFTFGIGYLSIAEGTGVEYLLPEFLRDLLAAELTDRHSIAASARSRWKVVAE